MDSESVEDDLKELFKTQCINPTFKSKRLNCYPFFNEYWRSLSLVEYSKPKSKAFFEGSNLS